MPADLVRAIAHAMSVLQWQENLPEADMPPEWMWHLDEELGDWFDEVTARREDAHPGHNDEVVPMTQNELTKGRKTR